MRVGVITGTGTYALPGVGDERGSPDAVSTRFGEALVTRGRIGEVEVLHVSRHGEGHKRLSNQVTHRANVAALAAEGATGVIGVTVWSIRA
jgi:purine nucleoside phosphorylase